MLLEKRRSFRLNIELPVAFHAYAGQKQVSLGMLNEMSALGFSLTTKEFLAVGQELSILVRLPDDMRITLPVKVVWTRASSVVDMKEYYVGVKILEPLNDQTSQYVRFYVRYFLSNCFPQNQNQN